MDVYIETCTFFLHRLFCHYKFISFVDSKMSLFALPRNAAELVSANQGTANAQYRQITSTRNVQTTAFPDGVIQFRWETGGNTWFVPDKSYFRIRYTLTQVRADAGPFLPPLHNGDLAPNMGLAANLFKSVEVRLNGQTVERIGERLAQVDALKTRMTKSKAWMDTIGKDTNFWAHDIETRAEQISVDGYQREASTHGLQYGIPLGQEQAGFNVATTFTYTAHAAADDPLLGSTHRLTMVAAAAENLAFGASALRSGDRVIMLDGEEEITAASPVFEVIAVVSALVMNVKIINHDASADIAAEAGFEIAKLKNTSHNDAVGKNSGELIWQPPLGFFDKQHAIPPGGTWTVEFDPENVSTYKKTAVQSIVTALVQNRGGLQADNVAGDFDFVVDQMYLYLYTVDANRFDNGDYFLDIQNVRCQQENMPADSTSLIQKNFDVNGKTNAITLAFADQQAGVSTLRSRSFFTIREGDPLANGGVSAPDGQERLLTRFYINYNNMQKPSPDFDGKYVDAVGDSTLTQTNHMVQRWADTMLQAGAYHTEGGAESFSDWMQRGAYYHFLWPKDAVENNTRVNVNYQFSAAFDDGLNHKVMLFNWWRTAYHVVHRNGRVEKMSVEEL